MQQVYPFKNTQGNIIIMVVLLSMMALTFFVFLMGYSLRNLEQVNNLQNSNIAYFAAEGGIEKGIVEYFSESLSQTINSQENICTSFSELGEALIDFVNCPAGDNLGVLQIIATRYKTKLSGFLDRYDVTEYWFTNSELESGKGISDLASIKLRWNTFSELDEQASLEVVVVRFPKSRPENIQAARKFLPQNSGVQEFIIEEFLPPVSGESGSVTNRFDTQRYNYIVFLKTQDQPTHFELIGLDQFGAEIELPDKNLTILSKAIIEDKRDESNTITRALQVEKEIYRDLDSNFPYAQYVFNDF